jgi:GrpB-like predicted nucleotidyltransferase (UPF0157 family)
VADPVVIRDYDRDWPTLFRKIAGPVREALGDIAIAVEHVGSTAVPGLASKPVIDLDVVVRTRTDVPVAIERLQPLGYRHQGDKGITGREALAWPKDTSRHHLYVVVEGSPPHLDHVRFRDCLRRDPELARRYGKLKMALAATHGDDRERYTEGKARFITDTLAAHTSRAEERP